MEIPINSIDDIKRVVGEMHDSEFKEEDFGYNSAAKTFYLRSRSSAILTTEKKEFILELRNVKNYDPVNLDKIKAKKAMGGVFDYIKVQDNGQVLTLVSQDLKIRLTLSKLEGRLEIL